MNKYILHSFTERDSARALLPPDKLFWRAQRRNTPAGMRFRVDRHALSPFPVDSQSNRSSLGKGDGKQKR